MLSGTPFVGVIAPVSFANGGELKRLLLLFEQLALDLSAQSLSMAERHAMSKGRNDFEFLQRSGLLTTLDGALAATRGREPEQSRDSELVTSLGLGGLDRALRTAAGVVGPAGNLRRPLRDVALELRQSVGLDAVAVGNETQIMIDAPATRADVVKLTLSALPMPSELTPWESIAEFRRDPDSKGKHVRLRNWINQVSKADLPMHELEAQFLELMFEYEQFLRDHEMRVTRGTFEVLITTGAELAEDFVKLKWGKAAKAPFELSRQRAGLYEAEQKAPGRAIAYIVKAQRHFR